VASQPSCDWRDADPASAVLEVVRHTTGERERAALARLDAAHERDEQAHARDSAATRRDEAADARARFDPHYDHEHLAAQDRRAAAGDREQAATERLRSLVDREALARESREPRP
jgi:hypothetical protein